MLAILPATSIASLKWLLTGTLVFVMLLAGVFFGGINATLLWQGFVGGHWFIEAPDFILTIVLQLVGALIVVGASAGWLFGWLMRLGGRPQWDERKMRFLLVLAAGGLLCVLGVHHWFENIICSRGGVASECGL